MSHPPSSRTGTRTRSSLPPADYPLRAQAEQALAAAANPPAGWQPLGYGAAEYLDLIRAICAYFRPFQGARGAIVDPFAGEEKQYATPCYAVAAALVALDGAPPAGIWGATRREPNAAPADPALLESAALAQDHALRSLAVEKNTAQNHADFFAPLVVLAYQLLAPFVAPERATRWLAELRSIDPEATYRNTFTWKREHGQDPTVHNWNVVAIAGELLRHQAGAGGALPWVDEYLTYQLREHADLSWGLYRDPNCPLPYDLFPRYHLAYALEAGTRVERGKTKDEGRRADGAAADGAHSSFVLRPSSSPSRYSALSAALRLRVADWLGRGEWTSALTQTASGGIPPGWRSSEHLWNDAALVALGEIAAARHARDGDTVAAGLFRRVAALAFRDMLHWRRPSGELYVVKNHFDPATRFGFEPYSFHSNYGLYPAAMLATAILFGDCRTPERPAPVETGTFVIRYPDPFHRLVATCQGLTLTFDLDADGHYDVTGLNSVRRLHRHPLLGPASGIPAHPRYHVPAPAGIACGPGITWTAPDGSTASLAGLRPKRVDLRIERLDADAVDFTLAYAVADAGCNTITSRYRLTPAGLDVEEHLSGAPTAQASAAFAYPFPTDDGRDRSTLSFAGEALHIMLGEGTQDVTVEGGGLALVPGQFAHRNGYAGIARGAAAGGQARWRVVYGTARKEA